MTPEFKFEFAHEVVSPSGQEVTQPVGWNDASISLRRDAQYHSLIEYFESGFVWYGSAKDFILNVRDTYGVNAVINVRVSIKTIADFELLFTGTLDLSLLERIYDKVSATIYKVKLPIVRDTLWSRFISKAETKIDLESTTDLYGGTRLPIAKKNVTLPSQLIQKRVDLRLDRGLNLQSLGDLELSNGGNYGINFVNTNNKVSAITFDNIVIDEIENNGIGTGLVDEDNVAALYTIKENGNYNLDIRLEVALMERYIFKTALLIGDSTNIHSDEFSRASNKFNRVGINLLFRINDEAPTQMNRQHFGLLPQNNGSTVFTHLQTRALKKGDRIFVYAKYTGEPTDSTGNLIMVNGIFTQVNCELQTLESWYTQWVVLGLRNTINHNGYNRTARVEECFTNFLQIPIWDGSAFGYVNSDVAVAPAPSGITTAPSYIKITADTEFQDTSTDAFLIGDAAKSILSKVVGADNVLKSNFFDLSIDRLNVMMRGKHVRGYTFTDKPLTVSWNEWFKSCGKMFALGVGYTDDGKIEIEPIEDFYTQDNSIELVEYYNLTVIEDQESLYNKIEIGFKKWSAESGSGIDDPQTKREWSTVFEQIGKKFEVVVDAYCAGLGIEQTRRNRVELGKDWRLDEDLMLINVRLNNSNNYEAAFNQAFTPPITGILNPSKRYNLRHTPARIFVKWYNIIQAAFGLYGGKLFKFSSGEGNFEMFSFLQYFDYKGRLREEAVSEKQDFIITSGAGARLYKGTLYDCDAPLSFDQYKLIKQNRKKSIGLKVNGQSKKFAIMDFKYQIAKGYVQLKLREL